MKPIKYILSVLLIEILYTNKAISREAFDVICKDVIIKEEKDINNSKFRLLENNFTNLNNFNI